MHIYEKDIARVCHEANRAYCVAIGDNSQTSWDEAPEWQRTSAIAGVMAIKVDPNRNSEQSHESWLEHKKNDGWTYGPVKDPVKKEHPCFVPYNELPIEQRMKDHLFNAIAKTLLATME